jgi:hypothetical protein
VTGSRPIVNKFLLIKNCIHKMQISAVQHQKLDFILVEMKIDPHLTSVIHRGMFPTRLVALITWMVRISYKDNKILRLSWVSSRCLLIV